MSRGARRHSWPLLAALALSVGVMETPRLSGQVQPPDAPSALRVVARDVDHVTLAWDPAIGGPAAEDYVIEGGLEPGQVLGAVPVSGPQTTVDFDLPPGRFWLRVHALAAGLRSGPSNEILLAAGQAAAGLEPDAPSNLLGAAVGDTLALSWTTPVSGGRPSRLWLLVSGTLNGAIALPATESMTVPGVPPGTYTFAVVAENSSGTSASTGPVTLTFPGGCAAPPEPPTDFRAWRVGDKLSVAWSPPASGAPVSAYRVHVAGAIGVTFDSTERSVSAIAPDGNFVVGVSSVSPCGLSVEVPEAPAWSTVSTQQTIHTVHAATVANVMGYRVFWSPSRASIDALSADVSYMDVAALPAPLPIPASRDELVYVRAAARFGPVAGPAGPVAASTTYAATEYDWWPATATPALFDVDGDGCLDMLGARGHCDQGFERYQLSTAGLDALRIDDTKTRDSRFADFTGDGIVDILSNVYTRADDLTVQVTLHVGRGDGTYTLDPGVAAMQIRGFGETIVAADFDNDGDIDAFLPHYSHLDDGGRNWLLINDGHGHFTDRAAAAGIAINDHHPPEAAQALDWNDDGWVDLLVGSHLYLNDGDGTFTDIAAQHALPVLFDEGARLVDLDLDGDLDLVHHDEFTTRVFYNVNGTFDGGAVVNGSPDQSSYGYGLNVCDVNGDGFEDVIVANNDTLTGGGSPHLLVNAGGTLTLSDYDTLPAVSNDLVACVDLDHSGLPDLVTRWSTMSSQAAETPATGGFRTYFHTGTAPAITVRVVGADGAKNQQGRTVILQPLSLPSRQLRRTVDGGSGYMAQNGYDLTVPTPWPGSYEVRVRVAQGWVTTTANAGDVLTVFEDGRVTAGLH